WEEGRAEYNRPFAQRNPHGLPEFISDDVSIRVECYRVITSRTLMLNALYELFPQRGLLGSGETERRWRPGTRRIPRNIELIPPPLRDVKDLKLQTPAIVAQANNVQVALIR